MKIPFVDRKTKQIFQEEVYGGAAIEWLYGDAVCQKIFSFICLPMITSWSWLSHFYGYLQKKPWSARKVAPFIQQFGIETGEFSKQKFTSFNDFFTRTLKAEARPVVSDPDRLAMPADGRYEVHPQIERFCVKGHSFDLREFLQDEALAARYAQGSMMKVRLCPADYHRFHFPCDGKAGPARLIRGKYFSVNPKALFARPSILWENQRMLTLIETEQWGTIAYVEIGATFVGTIHQTYSSGSFVKKGQEKGYFSFGGSCLVLLFEPGRVVFDEDLLRYSKEGYEVRAYFGQPFAGLKKSSSIEGAVHGAE